LFLIWWFLFIFVILYPNCWINQKVVKSAADIAVGILAAEDPD
jgi:uncharacterized membrane protein (DUF485 family)